MTLVLLSREIKNKPCFSETLGQKFIQIEYTVLGSNITDCKQQNQTIWFFVDLLRSRISTSEKVLIEKNVAADFPLKESCKSASYQKDIMNTNQENNE